MMFVKFVDAWIRVSSIVAFAKTVAPATLHTPEYPAMTVWLVGVQQPLFGTYETSALRDAEHDAIMEAIKRDQ